MTRAPWVLASVLALAAQTADASELAAKERKAAGEESSGAPDAYEQVLRARAPLLLKVRTLRASRHAFEVANDPAKGEQLERDIKTTFAELAALYDGYLTEHPDDARAHYDLGVLWYHEGENEDRARTLWLRTVQLDPDFHLAHNSLAVHYADTGDHDKALQHVSRALELDPDVAMYHFNAASFYFNFRTTARKMFDWDLGRCWQQIVSEHEEALRLDPGNYVFARDYAQCFYFAVHFKVEPDYSRARDVWKQALAAAPSPSERAMVCTHLARVSLSLEDYDAAREYLEQALTLRPDDPVALRLQRKIAEGEQAPEPAEKRPGADKHLRPATP